jgi:hypothetical protein
VFVVPRHGLKLVFLGWEKLALVCESALIARACQMSLYSKYGFSRAFSDVCPVPHRRFALKVPPGMKVLPGHCSYTEGHTTPDVADAAALLESLA